MTTLKRFKHTTGVPNMIFSCTNKLKLTSLTQIDTIFPLRYSQNMHFNAIFVFYTVIIDS